MHSASSEPQTSFSDDRCPRCNKPKATWSHPAGYAASGELFCCKGCATGFWCICRQSYSPIGAIYSGPERRVSPQRRAWKQERRAIFLRN